MVQKDLNLFLVFRQNVSKTSSKGSKGIVFIVIVFLLIVGLGYGGLKFYRGILEDDTSALRTKLSDETVIAASERLKEERKKTDLLRKYYAAVSGAKNAFSSTRHIDPLLISAITDAMPSNVTLSSFSATPSSAVLSCQSTNFLSPAVFTKALENDPLFISANYEGVRKGDSGIYTFTVTCTFADVKEEEK